MDGIKLHSGLMSLVVFRNLLKNPVIGALSRFLAADHRPQDERIGLYCEFAAELYRHTEHFSVFLLDAILEDENFYVLRRCAGNTVESCMEECLNHELDFLQRLSRIKSDELTESIQYDGYLPSYLTEELNFRGLYHERMQEIHRKGYGMYARYSMFTVCDGHPVPVEHPDPQTLWELPGYEREREKIIVNTEALLAGGPACNVLLYGDAGTGKSSAVKAVANAYFEQGLRLIEVKKTQLYQIPKLLDCLGNNPLKFILFVDDLSFNADDDNFSALKAILEGSVSGRGKNVAVYATSNRRHLVKESLSDREGDDIHYADTMQEMMSLSARFGLVITFQRPDKERYLQIVHELADRHGIQISRDELDRKAEAHAIRSGGRSARTAKQFVELLAAGIAE